jgi:hypothetical protein
VELLRRASHLSPVGAGRIASSPSPAPTVAKCAMSASSSRVACTSFTRTGPRVRSGLESPVIEPGHDAWVVGDEQVVGYEFEARAAEEYARR